MPSLADLFQPSQSPPPPPQEQESLRDRWARFMANPDNKAGLMQFGISMLAPSASPSLMGHFAQALGEAGQTVDQRVEQRNKEAETALNARLATSKLDLSERELAERQRENQAQEELAREGLEVNKFEADTSRMRIGADRRSLTANQEIDARQEATKLYHEMFAKPEVTEPDGTTREESEQEFVDRTLQSWGVPTISSGTATDSLAARMNPEGDIVAGAADAPRVVTPEPVVEGPVVEEPRAVNMKIEDHRQLYPGKFDAMITQVNLLRESGIPANIQRAEVVLRNARKYFIDAGEIDKFLVPIKPAAAATAAPAKLRSIPAPVGRGGR